MPDLIGQLPSRRGVVKGCGEPWDRNMRKGIGELIINNYFCGDLRFRNALQ